MSSADSLAVPPPGRVTGCIAFDLRITSNNAVAVTPAAAASCGLVVPVISGAARFDPASRVVQLTVALRNEGKVWLHAPARLEARRASLITNQPGPDDQVMAQWSYDTLLRSGMGPPVIAADGSEVLPSGATSLPKSIELRMPATETHLHVTLTATGTHVFTVPGRPPDEVPPDEMEASRSSDNIVTGDPHFPGRVERDKLWLIFRSAATPEDREAAIEAVNGIVVGGMLRSTGNRYPPPSGPHMQRYYYVRIPAYPDSGAVPLGRAIRTLAPLPQVQDVEADALRP